MDVTDTYLAALGPETWTGLVRRLLEDDRVEVLRLRHEPIFIGAGTGTHLFRATGSATTGAGQSTDWSLVIKVFTTEHLDFETLSDDPSAWNYWKREWEAYQTPWFTELIGPLVPPRCVGAGEISGGTGPVAWLALEDLGDVPHRWPLAEFGEVARALGQFGGRYLTEASNPTDPWLSDQWLVGLTEQAASVVGLLPAAADHPDAGRIYPTEVGTVFTSLWANRERVYAALDELPTTFTHNDVFPRNLRRRLVGEATQNVAFDWAFAGMAPLGAEVAPLVGATLAFLGSPPDEWDELERVCLAAYLRGLRSIGWDGTDEVVRFGYAATLVLRFGLGALPAIIGLTMFTEDKSIVEMAFGCTYEEFVENCGAAAQFLCERVREVHASSAM